MQKHPSSLIDLKSLTRHQILSLFSRAQELKTQPGGLDYRGQTAALIFFEPSTRTRFSFETALARCGFHPLVLDLPEGTSLEKGETEEDTVLNLAAMDPRLIIVRSSDAFPLSKVVSQVSCPVINAGWGTQGHPTQALLDGYTLFQEFNELQSLKILFVGDIKHSRVVASHFELLDKMGAEVGQCGPSQFMVDRPGTHLFRRLEEGLEWCDAVMALRFQFERHGQGLEFSKEDYRLSYGLTRSALRHLRPGGVMMHPGPVNYGIEIDAEVLTDSRNRILKQVHHGVFIREALIRTLLEGRL